MRTTAPSPPPAAGRWRPPGSKWPANARKSPVSLDAETFETFREYAAANPRRAQLRRENRHLLRTVRAASHPRLAAAAPGLHWDCTGEKDALRTFAEIPRVRVIRLLPYGLKEWKPHGRQLESLAESRLLILSAFPEETEGCNWENCHRNNDIAAALATTRP